MENFEKSLPKKLHVLNVMQVNTFCILAISMTNKPQIRILKDDVIQKPFDYSTMTMYFDLMKL